MWSLTINNKLTCEMKIRRGMVKSCGFKDMWNLYLEHVFLKGKGYRSAEESMYSWRSTGYTNGYF